MPELPEVETVVRGMARRITGAVVDAVHLGRTDVLHGDATPIGEALIGRRVGAITRQGKLIRIGFDGPFSLGVHLGMSGRLLVVDRGVAVEKHTHLRMTFRRRRAELRFIDPRRFGGLWLLRAVGDAHESHRRDAGATPHSTDPAGRGPVVDPGRWVGRPLPMLGDDALGLTYRRLKTLLARRRQIKPLLLDQQPIAGIGNIYCDEILHRARIHPLTRASELDDPTLRRLRQVLQRVLAEAIDAGGSSISDYRSVDNTPGTFQRKHRVYARAGRPCRRCRATIERLTVTGRSTFICPRCQPPSLPTP